jgi:hypothetical protein
MLIYDLKEMKTGSSVCGLQQKEEKKLRQEKQRPGPAL